MTTQPPQVLYRKWRSQRFADVMDQAQVTQTLLNALESGRIAHAYLFCGPRGTGKTSLGRIFAKAVNCLKNGKGEPCNECAICESISQGRNIDLIEIDAASNRGIDEIRSLREKVNFAPNQARYKVYILDEVHMLSKDAFNALLKTLEEPPPHTIFVLATTEADRLPATVVSRCQRFDFRRISMAGTIKRLGQICQGEGVQASHGALSALARAGGGSLRDAVNLLEQVIVAHGATIDEAQVKEMLGLGGEELVQQLTAAALTNDVPAGLAAITQASTDGLDLAQFQRRVTENLRAAMLVKAGAAEAVDLPNEEIQTLRELVSKTNLERITQAIRLFAQADLKGASASTLPLELALVDAASLPTAPTRPVQEAEPPPSRREAAAARPAAAPQWTPSAPVTAAPRAATGPGAPSARPNVPPRQAIAEEHASNRPAAALPSHMTPKPEPITFNGDVPTDAEGKTEFLRTHWRAVIEASRGKGQRFKLDALLRSGRVVGVQGEEVTIGFQHDMFVDRMKQETENPGTRRALEDAFEAVLHTRHRVRFVQTAPGARPSGGHLLKAAIEDLGAKVVKGPPATP